MSDIIHLKLVTGEEILAKDTEKTNTDSYYLERVRIVSIQPIGNGQATIVLMPFMFGNPDAIIKINKSKALGEPDEPTPKALEDMYIEQTSNIKLATTAPPQGKIQL